MFKRFFALICLFLLTPSLALANPFPAGTYETKIISNIRLKPNVNGQRIGYFKKGQSVQVKKAINNWCSVEYKNYSNAYVYCPLLNQKNGQQTNNLAEIVYTKYSSEKYKYSFEYPQDWNKIEDAYDRVFIAKGEKKSKNWNASASFLIVYDEIDGYVEGAEKFKSESLKNPDGLAFNLDYYRVPQNLLSLQSNPQQKFIIVVDETFENPPQGDHDGKIPNNIKGNWITFKYDPERYPEGDKVLKHILQSMQSDVEWDHHADKDGFNYDYAFPRSWGLGNFDENSTLEDNSPLLQFSDLDKKIDLEKWKKGKTETILSDGFRFILDFYESQNSSNDSKNNQYKIITQVSFHKYSYEEFTPHFNIVYLYTHPSESETLKNILLSFVLDRN